MVLALLLIVSIFCFKTLADTQKNMIFNSSKTSKTIVENNEETRTKADNILSTVNIQNIDSTYLENGTGSIIKMDNEEMLILTARHVLSDSTNMPYVILFGDGSETIATTKYISSKSDWAILTIPINNVPLSIRSIAKPVIIEDQKVGKGDKVYNIRYHHKDGITMYDGEITNTTYVNIRPDTKAYSSGIFIETNYSVITGASGGALYNENGKLIGICSQSGDSTTIFYPIEEVSMYLNEQL